MIGPSASEARLSRKVPRVLPVEGALSPGDCEAVGFSIPR